MLESSKNIRIKFNKKGDQKNFILKAQTSLGLTGFKLSQKLAFSQRTLSDWKREKFTLSYATAQKISKISGVALANDYKLVSFDEHLKKIGKAGGEKRMALYGRVTLDEEYREKKWREWWNNTGQYKTPAEGFNSLEKIRKPKKSISLAEFAGIMLGDGGISDYQISVCLSNKEVVYISYVSDLINKLFSVESKIYKLKHAEAVNIIVSRKELVDFCQSIGLVKGDKIRQQIDIPNWIKENKSYQRECIRGLIDTDGCFYTNSYISHGKKYSYFKIAFVSASIPLIKSVAEVLRNMGIKARISKNYRDVRIEESVYVKKYIEEIGSHNQKHLDKIARWEVKLDDDCKPKV